MKTTNYNPSPLEVSLATALGKLQEEIGKNLGDIEIVEIVSEVKKENPLLRFHLLDKDGDPHEVVLRIIQIPDKF